LGFADISVSASVGIDKTLLYSSPMQTTCARKHNKASQDSYLTKTLACVFINKQTIWTMEHALAVTAETKASSLIRLMKNHSKTLKLLQFENC